MGSFFTTCSVTNMVLNNQKTSVQLLVPHSYGNYDEHRGMVVSNEGTQAFFSPFGFPIHGRYYDYGRITDYVRDENIERIEKYFNLSIETIMESTGDARWHEYGELENNSSWKLKTLDGGKILHPELLLKLGMTYIRTEILEHLQGGFEKLTDGSESEPYSLDHYFKRGIVELTKSHGMTNRPKSVEDIEKSIKRLDKLDLPAKDREGFIEVLLSQLGTSKILSQSYIRSTVNFISELKIDPISDLSDMAKQFKFISNMNTLKKLLVPSNYGSQETNFSEIYKLNELTQNLLISDMMSDISESKNEDGTWDEEYLDDMGQLETYELLKHKINVNIR